MTKAIVIHQQGGTDVMKWEDSDPGDPGAGQVRIKHAAVGLNYIDILHRNGVYPFETPGTFGIEGSGVIEAIGDGIDEFSVGQRVAYGVAPPGAYAEARLVPAARIVALPDAIDDNTGAAIPRNAAIGLAQRDAIGHGLLAWVRAVGLRHGRGDQLQACPRQMHPIDDASGVRAQPGARSIASRHGNTLTHTHAHTRNQPTMLEPA